MLLWDQCRRSCGARETHSHRGVRLLLELEADARVHGAYATFSAFSTFSFSRACFTTSIISVT